MKSIQKLILLFSMVVIVFGFYQLQHEQDIFAQSKLPCCSNGQCKVACTSSTFVHAGSLCDSYLLTCKDCIDLEYSGCLDNCLNSTNGYCFKSGGEKYYGTTVSCLEQK
jgi:hypothetical protein